MTKREALIANMAITVNSNLIDLALINADISGAADYTKEDFESLEKVELEILHKILITPDISEGDLSIKYDRGAIRSRILFLASKYKMEDILSIIEPPKPTIDSPSIW